MQRARAGRMPSGVCGRGKAPFDPSGPFPLKAEEKRENIAQKKQLKALKLNLKGVRVGMIEMHKYTPL